MAADLFVIASVGEGGGGFDHGELMRSWVASHGLDADLVSVPGAALAVTKSQEANDALLWSDPDAGVIRATVAVSHQALELAERHPDPSSLGMEGGHVAVTVAPSDATVTAANDGLGAVPFYWGIRDRTLVGSTQLGALIALGLPLDWDEIALAQYLSLLHPLGERTVLRGVSCLPAGARLSVTPAATQLSSSPLFAPQDLGSVSDEAALRRFEEAWHDALVGLRDRTRGQRLGIGLSGGLDSRAVVSGLFGLGARPLTFTYGRSEQREVQISRAIADRLRLPHLGLPIGDEEMLAGLESSAAMLDGAHSPAEFYDSWFLGRLRQSIDVMVSGLWGGPLWGGDKSFGLSTPAAVADAYLKRVGSSLQAAAHFMAGWSRADVGTAVRDDSLAGLNRWGPPRQDLSVFWNVDNRQRRWGLMVPTAMARSGIRVEAPFLDGAVVASLASLAPEQRRYGNLHLLAHQRIFGDLADVPRGNDGNAPNALDHVYWSGDRSISRQLLDLGRSHPVSAARRLRTQGGGRMVARLPAGRFGAHLGDWIAAREEVFSAGEMARRRPVYRARLADYLEQGAGAVPSPLSGTSLQSAADQLRGLDDLTFDPLVAARAATVGEWARLWSEPAGRAVWQLPWMGASSGRA